VGDCVFCQIVRGEAPATVVREWDDALAIVPLNPVVDGHVLVLPKRHVATFFSDPDTSAATMRRAAEMLHGVERHYEPRDHNVITSAGRAATQTVFHLHVHIVPREPGDGLPLPWTPQHDAEGLLRQPGEREVLDGDARAALALLLASFAPLEDDPPLPDVELNHDSDIRGAVRTLRRVLAVALASAAHDEPEGGER